MGMVNETFKKKIMMKSEVAHTLYPSSYIDCSSIENNRVS